MISRMYTAVFLIFLLAAIAFISPNSLIAYEKPAQKPAIVLAAFGTTHPEALEAILNVEKKVKQAFPNYDVHLAFTSNIVRDKWKLRANDEKYKKQNPQIENRMYEIKNPLSVLALIQEDGARDIIVQSLHITNGSEFKELKSIVENLANITALQESLIPFPNLKIGDSATGNASKENVARVSKGLASLIKEAENKKAALVLVGHGNENIELSIYKNLEKQMNTDYETPVFIALLEGEPGVENLKEALKKEEIKNILLAPLMLVAGDHAKNDIASDEEDSWKSILKAEGYNVDVYLKGLGSVDSWADIYVERIKTLAEKK